MKAYRASHGCSYAEAMQGAKKTYRNLQEKSKYDHIFLELKAGCRLEIGNPDLLCIEQGKVKGQVLSLWREGTALAHEHQTFKDFNENDHLPITYHGHKYLIHKSFIKNIT